MFNSDTLTSIPSIKLRYRLLVCVYLKKLAIACFGWTLFQPRQESKSQHPQPEAKSGSSWLMGNVHDRCLCSEFCILLLHGTAKTKVVHSPILQISTKIEKLLDLWRLILIKKLGSSFQNLVGTLVTLDHNFGSVIRYRHCQHAMYLRNNNNYFTNSSLILLDNG